jgi:hypothetical protein
VNTKNQFKGFKVKKMVAVQSHIKSPQIHNELFGFFGKGGGHYIIPPIVEIRTKGKKEKQKCAHFMFFTLN